MLWFIDKNIINVSCDCCWARLPFALHIHEDVCVRFALIGRRIPKTATVADIHHTQVSKYIIIQTWINFNFGINECISSIGASNLQMEKHSTANSLFSKRMALRNAHGSPELSQGCGAPHLVIQYCELDAVEVFH